MKFQQKYLFSFFNTLCFENRAYEEDFNTWRAQARLEQISAITALTASLYLLYALLDYYIAPEEMAIIMMSVHAGVLFPLLFLISFLAKDLKHIQIVDALLFFSPIMAAISHLIMTSYLPSANIYSSELYLIIFWVFTVSGMRLYKASLSASIILLLVIYTSYSLPVNIFLMTMFWSLAAFAFGFLGAYLLERLHKNVYVHEKNLEELAQTDTLTGLYNRVRLEGLLEEELVRMKRFHHSFGCVFIDIDYFKQVNDDFGHKVGDEVLIEVSQLMLEATREVDSVIRWGGEEFVIVCVESDKEGMMALCEHLRDCIDKHCFAKVNHLSISIGVTLCHEEDSVDTLIQRADKALYIAKANGRNRIEYLEA